MTATYGELRTAKQKQIDEVVLARVKNGIALLEKEVGPDWVDRIDPASLTLSSASSCVLGQVYGNYYDALGFLGLRTNGDEEFVDYDYGFVISKEDVNSVAEDGAFEKLQEAWEYVLTPLVTKA